MWRYKRKKSEVPDIGDAIEAELMRDSIEGEKLIYPDENEEE